MVELLAAVALAVGPGPLAGPTVAWGGMRGWAGGAGGIVSSSDGGVHWGVQSRRPVRQLVATDTTHAWALSRDQTLRTTDGGAHWRSLGAQGLLRLSVADDAHGYAIERLYYLVRTNDGGVSWTPLNGPTGLQSLCFANARTGWIARGGTVWTTHDRAAHWTKRTLTRSAGLGELYCSGNNVWDVVHDGAAAGTEKYTVFHSPDGGASWHVRFGSFLGSDPRIPRVSNYAGPIAAQSDGSAVLEGSCAPCGAGSVTFVRVPGGRGTVANVLPGPLAFASRTLGLAVLTPSPRGTPTIYRTTTGGRTWVRTFTSRLLRP